MKKRREPEKETEGRKEGKKSRKERQEEKKEKEGREESKQRERNERKEEEKRDQRGRRGSNSGQYVSRAQRVMQDYYYPRKGTGERGEKEGTTSRPRPTSVLALPQKRKNKISNRMKKSLMSLVVIFPTSIPYKISCVSYQNGRYS